MTRGEVRVGQWRFRVKFLLFHDFIYHKILRKTGSRPEQISFNHGSGAWCFILILNATHIAFQRNCWLPLPLVTNQKIRDDAGSIASKTINYHYFCKFIYTCTKPVNNEAPHCGNIVFAILLVCSHEKHRLLRIASAIKKHYSFARCRFVMLFLVVSLVVLFQEVTSQTQVNNPLNLNRTG